MSNTNIRIKLTSARLDLESKAKLVKSRLRGVAHTSSSGADQFNLLMLKYKLTSCYILLAQLRGKEHLSERTNEESRNRLKSAADKMFDSLKAE